MGDISLHLYNVVLKSKEFDKMNKSTKMHPDSQQCIYKANPLKSGDAKLQGLKWIDSSMMLASCECGVNLRLLP